MPPWMRDKADRPSRLVDRIIGRGKLEFEKSTLSPAYGVYFGRS